MVATSLKAHISLLLRRCSSSNLSLPLYHSSIPLRGIRRQLTPLEFVENHEPTNDPRRIARRSRHLLADVHIVGHLQKAITMEVHESKREIFRRTIHHTPYTIHHTLAYSLILSITLPREAQSFPREGTLARARYYGVLSRVYDSSRRL